LGRFARFKTESIAMAITIRSAEADQLARELASLTGESITEAVTNALRERLRRRRAVGQPTRRKRLAALRALRAATAGREPADPRSDDEILGYNEFGAFD
jgi:antitoxin VapB